jgi:hypothetical protein
MPDPRLGRGPLSTIAGWMALIAVIGVAIGIPIVEPDAIGISYLLILIYFETLAALKFRAYRRRGEPMSGCAQAAWILSFLIVIPFLSIVAFIIGLFAYCAVLRPDAFKINVR